MIGLFEGDGVFIEDVPQPLEPRFERDNEIAAHIQSHPGVAASSNRVQASANADERTQMAFAFSQEAFIAPVAPAAAPHARGLRIDIFESAGNAAYLGISEAADDIAQRLVLVDRCRVREDEHLSA